MQIERQVSHCCCAKRYQVSKVAEGKYRVSGEGREGEGGECKQFGYTVYRTRKQLRACIHASANSRNFHDTELEKTCQQFV